MEDDFSKLVSSYLPSSFGKSVPKKKELVDEKKIDEPVVSKRPINDKDDKDDMDDKEETEMLEEMWDLPISKKVNIEQHTKTVSCIDIDASGSRMVTGGYDYNIGYYDFGGMDSSLQPFRYVNPDGAYKIKSLKFSGCSQWLLCATSSNKAVLMDRNGSKVRTYAEGDQYLRDLKHTSGHVAALTSCAWDPTSADHFMTSGADGTVRIWNIGYRQRQDHVIVVRSKKPSGGRSAVTHARYNNDASLILTGSEDGSLKIYPAKGPWNFASSEIVEAHSKGSEITSLAIDKSTGCLVASRATDGTLKLWDTRNWKLPIATRTGLPNLCSETACVFSPDDRLIATGTSAKKGEEWGKLVFLDPNNDLDLVHSVEELTRSSVVGLAWPSSINQIITGNGDGTASILYDPMLSKKGALLAMSKTPHTKEPAIVTDNPVGRIITPHALPLFRDTEGRSLKRARIKARKDPVKSHLPTPPVNGPGQGGRLGSGVTQAIMSQLIPPVNTRDEDPREALLKYAKVAEEEPMFVTPAYQQTQPKAILDPTILEREKEAELKKLSQKK